MIPIYPERTRVLMAARRLSKFWLDRVGLPLDAKEARAVRKHFAWELARRYHQRFGGEG